MFTKRLRVHVGNKLEASPSAHDLNCTTLGRDGIEQCMNMYTRVSTHLVLLGFAEFLVSGRGEVEFECVSDSVQHMCVHDHERHDFMIA